MTTAERELTDAECDAIIAEAFDTSNTVDVDRLGAEGWSDRMLVRAGWQARAGYAAPSPPSDEANQGAPPVAFKERLSEILMAAINKNDRYTFDEGHYIRWGAVERDILAAYAAPVSREGLGDAGEK